MRDIVGLAGPQSFWIGTDFFNAKKWLLQIRDSDRQGTAQGFRISNRYLHGDETDRVIADEQYANGTGPVYSATTPSAVAGTTLWAVADHLGSARDLVDNNGIVRKQVVFDSFGKRSGEVNRDSAGTVLPAMSPLAVDTAFGYTGADGDGDVGLTNHDARWYDSAIGRWLSQDPIGFAAGDPNLYRYVGNTPTTKTDPSGLETYLQNRQLNPHSLAVRSPREWLVTHTFIYTTDCDGSIKHTYSWGNEYNEANPSNWYIDRPEDISAAKAAERQRKLYYMFPAYVHWFMSDNFEDSIGNTEFDSIVDRVVREEIDRGRWSMSAHSWELFNNCKHEARTVIRKATRVQAGRLPEAEIYRDKK